jgi:hypothetical protein
MDRKKDGADDEDAKVPETEIKEEAGGYEEDGLWQKSILMGEKCQPPEFSGVIFYDGRGNQLPQMPRSPRASPLPSISFRAVKDANELEASNYMSPGKYMHVLENMCIIYFL